MSGLPAARLWLAHENFCLGKLAFAGRLSARLRRPWVKPARQTLWAGSSYRGTRNRHPPRGSTSLVASEQQPASNRSVDFRTYCLGFSIKVGPTKMIAWQPEGVTADFWYPSMRRAPPLAAARGAPTTPRKSVFFNNVSKKARALSTWSEHWLTARPVRDKALS